MVPSAGRPSRVLKFLHDSFVKDIIQVIRTALVVFSRRPATSRVQHDILMLQRGPSWVSLLSLLIG